MISVTWISSNPAKKLHQLHPQNQSSCPQRAIGDQTWKSSRPHQIHPSMAEKRICHHPPSFWINNILEGTPDWLRVDLKVIDVFPAKLHSSKVRARCGHSALMSCVCELWNQVKSNPKVKGMNLFLPSAVFPPPTKLGFSNRWVRCFWGLSV